MIAAQENVATQHQLLDRIAQAREQTDSLFKLVNRASLYERPIPERHRFIFYIGHLEAFDWNLFHESILGAKSFHPEFDRLFAFGIDPVGGGLPSDRASDWPSLDAVHAYVSRVRSTLDEKLACTIPEQRAGANGGSSLDTLLNVAIEHRLMHLETLSYMLHQLPFDKKVRQPSPPALATPPVMHRMIEIPAGVARLGLPRKAEGFGWDNEYEAHQTLVSTFEIDQFMVTNRQYLDFITAGGYETRALWSDADWNWKSAQAVFHPVFWKRVEDNWLYRSMFQEIPLPLDWPVYVSHAEATAYARWAGKSLPTEQEWHRSAYGSLDGKDRTYPWGNDAPSPRCGNFDFSHWDPQTVNAFPAGRSAFGVDGLMGNGWEWTSSAFAPFPGFEPFPFYPGYSADFFDGKHFVMKGGSPRTAACMLRPTFRNWFQVHYQYMYAGFRCVSR
ncbi:MAG: SUMF1/EgtB/PvdO family nonheme iron enzyme [Terriglobales bacterium]